MTQQIEWLKEKTPWLTPYLEWIQENTVLLGWIGGLSAVTVILSMIIVPILIVRMQADYFIEQRNEALAFRSQHPMLRVVVKIGKNILGALLVFAGILMCFLPGQGALTILIGLAVMDFPGKRKAEIWLVKRKPINWAINTMRAKANRPPLELPS